ncbi:KH domain-containing protein [Caldinitratiruptor microaerophilus]|uniref:RNA-binding protein KhpA n=1 Tax=Caldinitratiruptor microaerophilus TaxID=671077 RepID=A0AA35CJZ3_9FIRM|nr:KH domain-containing protein [Caldinitratiruptor microaerophilus]BDG60602.1 KH domain-containing protein [Caldinitratiruptor microaerophilus]
MKQLVEILVRSLVDHPDQVVVEQEETARSVTLTVHVAPDDLGKVIGRQGRVARAIRTVVKSAAVRDGRRVHVEFAQ